MHANSQRGISPAVGVVLLIGLTIILAAAVTALALDVADDGLEVPDLEPTPDATFDAEAARGQTTIEHAGGDELAADELVLEFDGETETWGESGVVSEGDSRHVPTEGEIRVVYEGEEIGSVSA